MSKWLIPAIIMWFQLHCCLLHVHHFPCEWTMTVIDGVSQKNVQHEPSIPQANSTTDHPSQADPESTNTTTAMDPGLLDPSNITNIDYKAAREYLQQLPADQIGNISGLVYLRPDLRVFRLLLLLEVRCGGARGAQLRRHLLRRLLAQRQLPEVRVRGDSVQSGPTELLLQAVPVRRGGGGAAFVVPLPLLAPQLTVTTDGTPSIAVARRQLTFNSSDSASVAPPPAALDLSCLGGRARASVSRSLATRLSRLQRVRLRPPLYSALAPTDGVTDESCPGELPPPGVLAGYRYLVHLVQTQFLEREQQQSETHDTLASPLQRMRERARLVDRAARYFYFARNHSIYVPPDSYEKVVPEAAGTGVNALPSAVYLDRDDVLQFHFIVPGSAPTRLLAEPGHLLQVGVECRAAADGWQRCTATVRPQPTARETQRPPAADHSWATVSLPVTGGEDGACDRRPPLPLRVAVGCPPSRTLLFNFTSTFKKAGLADKCPRCLCDRGVPCLLYSDVLQPQLTLVDWTTYQARPYTGNYTMTVLGVGYSASTIRLHSVARQRSLAERIWAPFVSDEDSVVPDELIENPVFPNRLFAGIKWHCDQYSNCPPFVRLRFSNKDVDSSTFCLHQVEVVVQLYGVPTNTFVDVLTMSAVFGVTLIVSLGYICWLAFHSGRVRPGKIVDLYPAQEPR